MKINYFMLLRLLQKMTNPKDMFGPSLLYLECLHLQLLSLVGKKLLVDSA